MRGKLGYLAAREMELRTDAVGTFTLERQTLSVPCRVLLSSSEKHINFNFYDLPLSKCV